MNASASPQPDPLLAQYRRRLPLLEAARATLEAEVQRLLRGEKNIDRIVFRVKEADSFVKKALKAREVPYLHPLTEIEDQIAGRVITFFLDDLAAVEEKLCGRFTTVENVHKEPPKDAEFGYESHHFVFLLPPDLTPEGWDEAVMPKTFELQLRTLLMHAWAEPQHDLLYKSAADLHKDVRKELYWIAASNWGADQAFMRVRQKLGIAHPPVGIARPREPR